MWQHIHTRLAVAAQAAFGVRVRGVLHEHGRSRCSQKTTMTKLAIRACASILEAAGDLIARLAAAVAMIAGRARAPLQACNHYHSSLRTHITQFKSHTGKSRHTGNRFEHRAHSRGASTGQVC